MGFKTFADAKRALTEGSKWSCQHHGMGQMKPRDMGVRVVEEKQSNGIGFRTERDTVSWLYYPPAKQVTIQDNGFTVMDDVNGMKLLTYTLVK